MGIYTLAPLNVFAGRSFMPDMGYLAFSVAALYLFTGWLDDEKSFLRFAVASTATTLAILVKLPAIIIALPMLYVAWTKYGATLVRKRGLWAFAACSILFPLIWYSHAYFLSLSHHPHHMFGGGGLETVSFDWYMSIVQQALTSAATPVTATAMLLGICLPPQAKFFFSSLSSFSFVYLKPLYEPVALAPWRAANELNRLAPFDALIAAGDGGDSTCIYYSKRRGSHFLEDFGAAPIDSHQAVTELERLKARGATYLVLTRHQPWWWSKRYEKLLELS